MKSLILGGDSFLGKALRDLLGEECFYTSRHLQQDSIYFDLLIPNFTVFRPYLQDLDVVYLTAAITSMADCQEDVQKSSLINVESTIEAIEYFSSFGVYCVFLSSTAVFSKFCSNRSEYSKTQPQSIYGQQKNRVEDHIRMSSPKNACIIRMNKIWGLESSIFFSWYMSVLKSERPRVFNEKRVAPISLSTAVRYLISIGHSKPLGTLHLTTTHDVSYGQLAKYFSELNFVTFPEGFDWDSSQEYSDDAVFLSSLRPESKVCSLDKELNVIKREFIEYF